MVPVRSGQIQEGTDRERTSISPVVPKNDWFDCQAEEHQKTTRAYYFFLRVGVSGAPRAREHLRIGRWGIVGGGFEALKQAIPLPPLVPKLFPSIVLGLRCSVEYKIIQGTRTPDYLTPGKSHGSVSQAVDKDIINGAPQRQMRGTRTRPGEWLYRSNRTSVGRYPGQRSLRGIRSAGERLVGKVHTGYIDERIIREVLSCLDHADGDTGVFCKSSFAVIMRI